MSEEYETILHRWFDKVWNQKDANAIWELLAPDVKIHGISGPSGEPILGPEAFAEFHAGFLQAFPDIHVTVDHAIEKDDKVAGRFTVHATQEGPLPDIAATGKKVLFTGSGIAIIRDGQFVEIWNDIDFLKMQYDLAPDTPDVE